MNAKHPLYKEAIKVQAEIYALWQVQRTKNWVELEKPYKDGYYKFSDLRDDIKNRSDAWVFYECLKLVGGRVWCKHKSFKRKLGKGKFEYIYQEFGEISEDAYDGLHSAVKKYFIEISPYHRRWSPFRKLYKCNVPPYYFVDKIKPRWITHYQENDSVLVKTEGEKIDYLSQRKFWSAGLGWYNRRGGSAPKYFVKGYNRSDRRHNKAAAKKNAFSDGDCDIIEYRYAHRHSARWDFW